MKLSNKTYDILKSLSTIWMPGLATCVIAVGEIWELPYYTQIAATITALAAFIGTGIGVSSKEYWETHEIEVIPENPKWVMRTTMDGLEYGGYAHDYYWNPAINPGASVECCLADCTTYAYGRVLEAGSTAPISGWHSAGAWPNCLANGWTCEPYSPHTIRKGDIVCWVSGNHVAVIEGWDASIGVIYVSESLYTGDHGVAYYNGSYDSRTVMGYDMKSVSDWMIANYPARFFTCDSLYWVGLGDPDYILRNPIQYD